MTRHRPKPLRNPSKASKEQWSIADFEIGKPLGKCKFGHLYLARDIKSRYIVALKVINKNHIEKSKLQDKLRKVLEVKRCLHHPNILDLHGCFQDSKRMFLILEYPFGGDVYRKLRESGHFSETQATTYIASLAHALAYCRKKNVVYSKIVPANLMINHQARLKITDFGYSVKSKAKGATRSSVYLAPEMVEREPVDRAVDGWTLGVLCYEFLCGVHPFEAESEIDSSSRIMNIDFSFPSTPDVSVEAKDFISLLLVKDSSERLSFQKITEHPWIVKNADPLSI